MNANKWITVVLNTIKSDEFKNITKFIVDSLDPRTTGGIFKKIRRSKNKRKCENIFCYKHKFLKLLTYFFCYKFTHL